MLQKIEKLSQQLLEQSKQISKNQVDGMASLRLELTNLSNVVNKQIVECKETNENQVESIASLSLEMTNLSSVVNKQLIESKETNKNLVDGMASLRLEIKNLSISNCPKKTTYYPLPESDLFVSYWFFLVEYAKICVRVLFR